MGKTQVRMAAIPPCDFCQHDNPGEARNALYDGKTVHGSWAYMCQYHWERYGVGKLGTGLGQRLRKRSANGRAIPDKPAGQR